jgi:GNAT superfamily N-acetyltransferase
MLVHRSGTDGAAAHILKIVRTRYDSLDSQRLIDELQAEYVWRYGGQDSTPVAAGEFEPPNGLFLVGYDGAVPVAMGGWRWHDPGTSGNVPGSSPAEIKRRRGHARAVLAALEETARASSADWLVLETGQAQPEAISLYQSSGYLEIPHFGHYADAPLAVHLGKPLV